MWSLPPLFRVVQQILHILLSTRTSITTFIANRLRQFRHNTDYIYKKIKKKHRKTYIYSYVKTQKIIAQIVVKLKNIKFYNKMVRTKNYNQLFWQHNKTPKKIHKTL